jgi:hypothetical protein
MSIYPRYKATRSLFFPIGQGAGFTVEIATDKRVKGCRVAGRPAASWWKAT